MTGPAYRLKIEPDDNEAKAPLAGGGGAHGVSSLEGYDDTLYFYGQVSQESAHEFIRKLKQSERALKKKQAELSNDVALHYYPRIELYLNSFGGDVFAGFAIANAIAACKIPIDCYVQGIAASAGTLIALAAPKTIMYANSFLLIHQHSSFFWGTHEQWKDESKLQGLLIEQLIQFYRDHTRRTEDEIREMLKHDYWMDAHEALAKGFVQELQLL